MMNETKTRFGNQEYKSKKNQVMYILKMLNLNYSEDDRSLFFWWFPD